MLSVIDNPQKSFLSETINLPKNFLLQSNLMRNFGLKILLFW